MSLLYVKKVYRSYGFHSKIFSYQHLFYQLFVFPTFKLLVCVQICRQERSHCREPWGHAPSTPPDFNFRTKQGQQFQFQTSGILLFKGVQKLYGPEISRFLPCIQQFLDNLRQIFIFSNYIRKMHHFTLDLDLLKFL